MATFDFDFEGICRGDAIAVADMLEQIQAAYEEWNARLAMSLQINQEYEPGPANFATAWINASDENTLPIPDKVRFTWVNSDGLAGEYMAVNGEVTRLENLYYSHRTFHLYADTLASPLVTINGTSGPSINLTNQPILRTAYMIAKGNYLAGRWASGAFTGDKIQINAQAGANPVTSTPVGIKFAFTVPTGTGPYVVPGYFEYAARVTGTPDDFDLNTEAYSATPVTLDGLVGGTQMPPYSVVPSQTSVLFRYPYGEIVYEDI